MRACHCTLPYSNPNACEGCPNNIEEWGIKPFIWTQPVKNPWDTITRITDSSSKYMHGKWYVVGHVHGLTIKNHVCFCVNSMNNNYWLIGTEKSFVFDKNGVWVDNPTTYTSASVIESAYVSEKPFDSKEEAEVSIGRITNVQAEPEKKEEKKMKNEMDEDVFNASADKIVELLLDAGRTFTPHIVTQLLRKTDAFVSHQQVRIYFDVADEQGWTDFDYAVGYAYVNNSPTKSRVYYLEEDDDVGLKDSITIDIKDFETEMNAFLGWFNSEYEYEEGTEAKAPDWNISLGDTITYTWPNDGTTKIVWDLGKEKT